MERSERMTAKFRDLYGREPEVRVRAPGRVDLMGSHTDYNLGFVMTMPLNLDTWIEAAPNGSGKVRMFSLNKDESGEFVLHPGADGGGAAPDNPEIGLASLPEHNGSPSPSTWIRYPWGVAEVLQEEGYSVRGFDAVIHSTIPLGGGLSSSAAIEAATFLVFQTLGGWEVPKLETALLCQRAENRYVGMNCGILDQYSSILGEAGTTILLDCKYLSHEAVPFPDEYAVVICDTKAPRELTGSEYGDRRRQCEEAAAFFAERLPEAESLRDVTIKQFERYAALLPPVQAKRSRFVIEENRRVLDLAGALQKRDASLIAKLFDESFSGAKTLYEIVVPEMEAMAAAMLSSPGAVGARQAGAGFGGCMVAVVEKESAGAFCDAVLPSYKKAAGIDAAAYIVSPEAGAGIL